MPGRRAGPVPSAAVSRRARCGCSDPPRRRRRARGRCGPPDRPCEPSSTSRRRPCEGGRRGAGFRSGETLSANALFMNGRSLRVTTSRRFSVSPALKIASGSPPRCRSSSRLESHVASRTSRPAIGPSTLRARPPRDGTTQISILLRSEGFDTVRTKATVRPSGDTSGAAAFRAMSFLPCPSRRTYVIRSVVPTRRS